MDKEAMVLAAKSRLCRFMLQEVAAYNEMQAVSKDIMERRVKEIGDDLDEGMPMVMPSDDDPDLTDSEREKMQAAMQKREEAERARVRFSRELAAHPLLSDEMLMFNIDVLGSQSCFGDSQLNGNVLTAEDIQEVVGEEESQKIHLGYKEREEVRDTLKGHGFHTHSSGGGVVGWDLGYSCNSRDAERLCATIWAHYHTELTVGFIRVLRRGLDCPQFPGMTNWDDAQKFAKEHEITID